ncbi:MAG: phosphogluconate dehydrogenase (NAD(+)-dependent, decarboxylating) [Halothiobacillaceae bacterium]
MRIGIYGLGRMGANMARRLVRAGIEVVGYNRSPGPIEALVEEGVGFLPAHSLDAFLEQLPVPRIVWLMLPAGEVTEAAIERILPRLAPEDLLVDGGNAFYQDTLRRGERIAPTGVRFMDVGVSGGIWGLRNGYCVMAGGSAEDVARLTSVFKALAPAPDRGWAHVGPLGAGHFTKMVHNGIEYGMMQALAEGLALLKAKGSFAIDLAQVSELWRHGSVVQSWLLDLTAEALAQDRQLATIAPCVTDSGEGRWTAKEAIDLGVSAPVITLALHMRFASQGNADYGNKLLAVMRQAFGGHAVMPAGE